MVESTPAKEVAVYGSGGMSGRDGGGKGLFESIDEADGATCLRSTPLYTPLHTPTRSRSFFLFSVLLPSSLTSLGGTYF